MLLLRRKLCSRGSLFQKYVRNLGNSGGHNLVEHMVENEQRDAMGINEAIFSLWVTHVDCSKALIKNNVLDAPNEVS